MSKAVTDAVVTATITIVCIVVSAFIMAHVWTAIDAMRQFGTGDAQFLEQTLKAAKVAEEARHDYEPGSFMGAVESGIKWYNLTFLGPARYGSGLGIFIGAFLAMLTLRNRRFSSRVLSALIAGGFVGGRLCLMVTSNPFLVLLGTILGAPILCAVQIFQSRQEQLPELPTIT